MPKKFWTFILNNQTNEKGENLMKFKALKSTRLGLVATLVVMLLGISSQVSIAETFPDREIELVINFAPGGSTDMMARIVGNEVSKHLGVPVVFNNKPGGGGAIAANYVANAKPDGYVIGTAGASNLGTLLATSDKIPYTLEEFSGVARAAIVPLVIVAKKGRFENFEALVKEAKQKPGTIMFGSWGSKSTSHIMGELINQVLGIKMKHVPFDGGAKALVAVLGGHIDIAVSTPSTSLSNLKAGTVVALAVTTPNRVDDIPDAPTMKELGHPSATFASYDGFVTSSKIPKERLAVLLSAFEKSLKEPEVQEALKKAGMVPGFLGGKDYDAFLANNLDLLKSVATKAGITE
jgi:tripartite-type tricarboxylate transporter receptor subunit TctC